MPAKRRNRKHQLKKQKKISIGQLKVVIIFLLVSVSLIYIFLTTKHWDGKTKLSMVINNGERGVSLVTYDPQLDEIVNMVVPASTQINLSRQLGTWKIESVWQLGINEGFAGQLLSESITRHFNFPVYIWADSQASGFLETNPMGLIKAAVSPYETNLKLGDRIRLAWFALGVKNSKRLTINLEETVFLSEIELVGGERGYVKTGRLPQRLAVIFSDPTISKKNLKVVIHDATGKVGLAQDVGELIETVGLKIASVVKQERDDFDCEIYSEDSEVVEKLSKILLCQSLDEPYEGNFDVEIRIGEKFAERY